MIRSQIEGGDQGIGRASQRARPRRRSRAAPRVAGARPASSAAAVVPSGRPAARHQVRAKAVPELIGSTQPRRPQRQGGPAGSTRIWPSWPGGAAAADDAGLFDDAAADAGADGQHREVRAGRAPAPRAASASSAMLQSLSMATGGPRRSSIRGRQIGATRDRHSRPTAPAAARSRTRPGTPMPMADTLGHVGPRRSARAGAPAPRRGSRNALVRGRGRGSLPAAETRAARRCVPPMSMPMAVGAHGVRPWRDGAGDHRLDLAQARHGDGLEPLARHRRGRARCSPSTATGRR